MNLIDADNIKIPSDVPYKGAVRRTIIQQSIAFDIDMVLEQLEDYGKYKGVLHCNEDKCENFIPVSLAKQIVKGRGLGGVLGYIDTINKNCSTCKNNVEFPPPHTCDICTSLDQKEEYEMWEAK